MIHQSLREAYDAQLVIGRPLLDELKELFRSRDRTWYYTSRLKEPESFFQKVETGRVKDPGKLEDFVGATLVVPLLSDVPLAIEFAERFMLIESRRPKSSVVTRKSSSDFRFDDLRLYGTLRPSADVPTRPIDSMIFELQIKTFLQYSWAIATHDLVYKFDRVSWPRSRVAFQLKAILEHADLSVSAMASLEDSDFLPKDGEPEARLQRIIELLDSEWDVAVLAKDRKRQAENLDALISALKITDFEQFQTLVEEGRTAAGGQHPEGLSPYECVIEYATASLPSQLRTALTAPSRDARRLLVTPEVLRRLELTDARNAIL